jgi:hypothetical protein
LRSVFSQEYSLQRSQSHAGNRSGGSVSLSYRFVASVVAAAIGALACLFLRKSWSAGVALIDFVLAAVSAVFVAYAVMELDKYGSAPYSPASFVLPAAVCIVVVRHLARLTF